jgi:hypothetical protein
MGSFELFIEEQNIKKGGITGHRTKENRKKSMSMKNKTRINL